MTDNLMRHSQLAAVLPTLQLPADVQIRAWTEADAPTIQHLSDLQGWPTHHTPEEVLASWRNAWPALVATNDERVIGYVRGLTDGYVSLHITDLLVDATYRVRGVGRQLLEASHLLYPRTLLNLVAEETAIPFYEKIGLRYGGKCYIKVFGK